MSDKHIKFGDERDPKISEEQDLARYAFPCCGTMVDDRGRIKALQQGIWHARDDGRELFSYLRAAKPRKICFHSPGWISPLVANSEIAAAFLRGLKDPEDMHYYDNQLKAVAHVPYRQNRKEENILALCDGRPEGLVPGGGKVSALVAGVDTQDNSFVFSIRAFGWGLTQESWQIRHGEVDSFAGLVKILFDDPYLDSAGLYFPIHLAVMDTGGHRTSEVYDFCRMYPGRIKAYKGASGRKANPKTKTVIDTYPGTKIPIPGGLDLWICDTHHYKDLLAAKLRIKKDDPGAYHYNQNTTGDFARQMCAEYVDSRRRWQCPKGKANHYWDCSVMELVAADMLQLKFSEQQGE